MAETGFEGKQSIGDIMYEGLRVVRGPDWSRGESDGGEGHVGTVVSREGADRVDVIWDGGQRTTCRAGKDGKHDLRILDTGSIGIRHRGFTCVGCDTKDFLGMRWTCSQCKSDTLCLPCYSADKHNTSHVFLRHDMPGDSGVEVKKRTTCLKVRSLGLYPGARVVRGEDWKWGLQDGGSGNKGTITEIHDEPRAGTTRSTVRVKWDVGPSNLYRVGHEGKVDVKYVEEAPGLFYYRDNMPVLDVMGPQRPQPAASAEIVVGCKVCIQLDQDEMKRVQADKGGWTASMAECVGKFGTVREIPCDGVASVEFENSRYRLATEALTKVYDHNVNDVVRVVSDKKKVQLLQDGHGEWNAKMEESLGKVGRVKRVDSDGDVVVLFGSRKWIFNPACCVPAPGENVDDGDGGAGDAVLGLDAVPALGQMLDGLLGNLTRLVGGDVSIAMGGMTGAIVKGDLDAVKAMVQTKPEMLSEASGMQRLTPLMIACHEGQVQIARFLLESGADLDTKGHMGITPLSAALVGKKEAIVTMLIERGANIHHRHQNGQTTLHLAVHNNLPHVLKMLVEKGVDVNVTDKAGDTPLHDAIFIKNHECAEVLIECPRTDLQKFNEQNFNPLQWACLKDAVPSVEKILERDTSFVNDLMFNDTFSALHIAAANDHVECGRLLLDKGKAEVNRKGRQGLSPLHIAVSQPYYRAAELLLQKGADPNFENQMGDRPLHVMCVHASQKGAISSSEAEKFFRVGQLLLQNGAAYKAKNALGIAALDLCNNGGVKKAIQKYIDQHQDSLNTTTTSSAHSVAHGLGGLNLLDIPTPCSKCFLRPSDAKFVPCAHKVMCKSCADDCSKCPVCDTPVQTARRVTQDDNDSPGVQCKMQ
ncbi:E3 ubiquitin-protein ligase MIB2-like [Haliotis rubra]|uniref:E3 ubiquitin-protein ligase MIB2-like n=1 Tax=Haliotis rubra TaxID=36100 RepID=UPI001EE50533|nr:E3 ubiquitin-protein ligase MIB2-like [Haliotis rubra]